MLQVFVDKIDFNADVSTLNCFGIVLQKHLEQITDKMRLIESFSAYRLLAKSLTDIGIDCEKTDVAFTSNGKPYLVGCDKKISVSHSADLVAVAISDSEVGVDVQVAKVPKNVAITKKIMSSDEFALFENSQNKLEVFACLWSRKEAHKKLSGVGVNTSIGKINTVGVGFDYYLMSYVFDFDGKKYCCSVANEQNENEVLVCYTKCEYKKVDFL